MQSRTDKPNVTYIEKIEFLMQSLALKIDDELLVYLLRFKAAIEEDSKTLNKESSLGSKFIHPILLPKNS